MEEFRQNFLESPPEKAQSPVLFGMTQSTQSPDRIRARWNEDITHILLDCILEAKTNGTFVDNSIKTSGWNSIKRMFLSRTGLEMSTDQLTNRFAYLKADYFIFKSMKSNSGFGWDADRRLPTAPEDVWDRYLTIHKKAAKFRTETFPFFDVMESILNGSVATGEFAIASNKLQNFSSPSTGLKSLSLIPLKMPASSNDSSDHFADSSESSAIKSDRTNDGRQSKRKRTPKDNGEVAAALNRLASTQEKLLTSGDDIMTSFINLMGRLKPDLPPADRAFIKMHFNKNGKDAEAFVKYMIDDERLSVLENLLSER